MLWLSHGTAKVNEKIYQNQENKLLLNSKIYTNALLFLKKYVAADFQQGTSYVTDLQCLLIN